MLFIGTLIASLLVIAAGLYHYDTYFRSRVEAKSRVVSFQLMDTDRQVVDFKAWREGKKVWLVYLPDDESTQAQAEFGKLLKMESKLEAAGWRLLVASRLDIEYLFNLKRVSGLRAPILNDPSGSILSQIGAARTGQEFKNWFGIWLTEGGEWERVESMEGLGFDWLNKK